MLLEQRIRSIASSLAVVLLAAALAVLAVRLAPWFIPPEPVTRIEHAHGLAVDPQDRRVLWIGSHAGLLRTIAGREWARVGRQRYDMMGFTIAPGQRPVMLTSGHPGRTDQRDEPLGLEASGNRGRTWQQVALAGKADFHALTVARGDPRIIYAWNVSGRVGLYRSRSGGRQWEFLGARPLDEVYSLAVSPRNPALVLAGTSRGLMRSADGGGTWQPLTGIRAGAPVTVVEVHPAEPRVVYAYAMAPTLGLLRSEDGGGTWTPVGFYLGAQDAVSTLALDPVDPRVLYLATYGGDLFRATDGGRHRERWVADGKIVRR